MKQKRTAFISRVALAAAVSGALAFSPVLSPLSAYAETTESLQEQLAAAQAELDELQKQVDQSQAVLGKTNYELDQTKTKISELEAQISENEEKLASAQTELSSHVSVSYKQGNATLLSIILDSNNFSELINRVFYANTITKSEEENIQEVIELRESLKNDKADLEEQKEEQEKLLKSQEAEAANAEAAAAKQASYVNGLSAEVKAALEEERIRKAEEARKAAEEAIRQEEQEKNNETGNNDDNGGNASNNNGSSNNTGNSGSNSSNGGSSNNGGNSSNANGGSSNGGSSTVGGGSSNATSSQRQTAVNAAKSQIGKPYGHSNDGSNWDCNGLTSYAWAQAGVSIPQSSGHYGYGQFQWMKNSGRWVTSVSQLQLGDLVFYSYDGGVTTYHVALYIGGGQVVHANGYNWGVHTSSIYFDYGFCGGGSPI